MCERAHPHECEEIPWRLMPGLRLKANQEWLMCNGYSGLHHRGLLSSDRLPAPLAGWLAVWRVSGLSVPMSTHLSLGWAQRGVG